MHHEQTRQALWQCRWALSISNRIGSWWHWAALQKRWADAQRRTSCPSSAKLRTPDVNVMRKAVAVDKSSDRSKNSSLRTKRSRAANIASNSQPCNPSSSSENSNIYWPNDRYRSARKTLRRRRQSLSWQIKMQAPKKSFTNTSEPKSPDVTLTESPWFGADLSCTGDPKTDPRKPSRAVGVDCMPSRRRLRSLNCTRSPKISSLESEMAEKYKSRAWLYGNEHLRDEIRGLNIPFAATNVDTELETQTSTARHENLNPDLLLYASHKCYQLCVTKIA